AACSQSHTVGTLPPETTNPVPSPCVPARHLSRARRSGRTRAENDIGRPSASKNCFRTSPGKNEKRPENRASFASPGVELLQLDRRAGVLELLLDRRRLVLAAVLLDRLGCAVDEVLLL